MTIMVIKTRTIYDEVIQFTPCDRAEFVAVFANDDGTLLTRRVDAFGVCNVFVRCYYEDGGHSDTDYGTAIVSFGLYGGRWEMNEECENFMGITRLGASLIEFVR